MVPTYVKYGASCIASLVIAWGLWYALVLRRVRYRHTDWGPRGLAVWASKVWSNFSQRQVGGITENIDELIHKEVFKVGKQYIIVWHPHGQYTLAALCFMPYLFLTKVPMKVMTVVADLLLKVPGLAEYLLLLGTRSGNFKTFDQLLSKGFTVAVQPGGILEQVNTDFAQEKVYFHRRLGFIRLAIKHGIPLIPMYAFGENQLYDTAPWQRRFNMWMYKMFKVGNLICMGRFGLPSTPVLPTPGILPVPGRPLHMRFGNAVDAGPAEAEPSEERVQELLRKYVAELQRMFEMYKDDCLLPEVAARGLKAIWAGNIDPNGPPETILQ